MTLVAEKFNLDLAEVQFLDTEAVTAIAVPEMQADEAVRQRAVRFIGACATSEEVEVVEEQQIDSLHDAVHKAAEGNKEALRMVETNVLTDVIERTIKTGHVIKVDLYVDEMGKIQQHGQSMESVQANSLRHAANSWQMRERTEAEATNALRIEHLYANGALQEYSFVVFSCAADNMSQKDMREAGFFTETMSCAIQVTAAEGSTLTTESAFVSGIKAAGGKRHDIETVTKMAEKLGVDLSGKTATEILSTPLLVPNSLLTNGAIDLVRLYDECAEDTFFGEIREQQDYLEYKNQCEERQEMLQPKIKLITQELIDEAPSIYDRVQATKRLAKLSEKHMLQQAVFDASIDLRVFGAEAMPHILEARLQFEQGNNQQALKEVTAAIAVAKSSSCPSGSSGSGAENDKADSTSSDDEPCTYVSKTCPKCGEKNVLTTVTKTRISGSCGCSVSKKS